MHNIKRAVDNFAREILKKPVEITSIVPQGENWVVEAEMVVYDDYMQQRAKKAIIETYEIKLDKALSILSYKRIKMRERGTIHND